MTQSVLQSLWSAAMSHSFRQLHLFFSFYPRAHTHTHKSASHPAVLLPWFAESPGWCARCLHKRMTHRGHPRSAGSAWAEREGEGSQGITLGNALEMKGTFWKVSLLLWSDWLSCRCRGVSLANVTKYHDRGWLYRRRRSRKSRGHVCVCMLTCFALLYSPISVVVCTDTDLLIDKPLAGLTLRGCRCKRLYHGSLGLYRNTTLVWG